MTEKIEAQNAQIDQLISVQDKELCDYCYEKENIRKNFDNLSMQNFDNLNMQILTNCGFVI